MIQLWLFSASCQSVNRILSVLKLDIWLHQQSTLWLQDSVKSVQHLLNVPVFIAYLYKLK